MHLTVCGLFLYMTITILAAVYLIGYGLAFIMQRTEIAAEKEPYTFGDRLLIASMSLLSWVWVIVVLTTSWIRYIRQTGFWDEPVTRTEVINYKKQPVQN